MVAGVIAPAQAVHPSQGKAGTLRRSAIAWPAGEEFIDQRIGLVGTVSRPLAVKTELATFDRERTHHFTLTRKAPSIFFAGWPTRPSRPGC